MDEDCRGHLARERTDRIGCVWVFISMFDFRSGGSSQKLLTDKKRGSKRITGNCTFTAKHDKPTCSSENSQELREGEDVVLVMSETGSLSVRTLIEEEMSAKKEREYDGKTQETREKQRRRHKSCSKSHDGIDVPIAGGHSDDRSVSSLPSCMKNNDGGDGVHSKVDGMNGACEEKFSELIKRMIAQKEGEVQSRKDPSCSKEEPSLPLVEDSERTEEEDPGTVEEHVVSEQEVSIEQKKHRFLNRKGESPEISCSDQDSTSQSPRTIVILKPGPNSSDMGSSPRSRSAVKKSWNGSRFLLGVMKRMLKSAAKKEQCGGRHVNDGASEAVSDLSESCCLKEEVHREGIAQTSQDSKKSMSGIYIAAKKHLSEMLENGDIDVNLPSKEVPRILGRILSLPQFSSPAASPGRTSLTHMTEKPTIPPCSSDDDYSEPLGLGSDELVDEDSDKHDGTASAIDALMPGGVSSTLVEADNMEEIQTTDVDEDELEWHEDNGDKQPLKQFHQTFDGLQSSSSPPASPPNSSVRMNDCHESATDVPGKLSPVSVLEPPFTDDDMSPKGSRSRSGEMRMQPLCIRFDKPESPKADHENDNAGTSVDDKESTLAFVKAVIKASGFDWERLCIKSFHTDQLLEPDLINDIDLCPNQLCNDKKLLLDCIDEVLMEFCGNEFGSGPWMSFVKPTVWIMSGMEDLVEMAEEEVYWHLQPLPYPHTLDQIVSKDIARNANWMDLRFDSGCIGTETGDIILDELLDESIRSLHRFGPACKHDTSALYMLTH